MKPETKTKDIFYKILNLEYKKSNFSEYLNADLVSIREYSKFGRLEEYLIRFEKQIPNYSIDKSLSLISKQRTLNSLKIMSVFSQLVGKLNSKNIEFYTLKGIHLNLRYYKDVSLRPIRDIDVLVKENYLYDFLETAYDLGFRFISNVLLHPSDYAPSNYSHETCTLVKDGVHLEVHNRILDTKYDTINLLEETLISEYSEIDFLNSKLKVLTPENLIIHIVYHATLKNGFDNGAISLCDVSKILDSEEIDYDLLLSAAKRANLEIAIGTFLFLVEKRMNVKIAKHNLDLFHKLESKDLYDFESLLIFSDVSPLLVKLFLHKNFNRLSSNFSRDAVRAEFGESKYFSIKVIKRAIRQLKILIKELIKLLINQNYRKKLFKVIKIVNKTNAKDAKSN